MLPIGTVRRRRFNQINESAVTVFAHLHTEMYTNSLHVFAAVDLTFSRRTATVFQQIMELHWQSVQTHTVEAVQGIQGMPWINNNLTNCNLNSFTTVPEGSVNLSLEPADSQIIRLEEYFSDIRINYLREATVFEHTWNLHSTTTDNYGLEEHYSDVELNNQRTTTVFEPSLDSFSESEENLVFTFGYSSDTELRNLSITGVVEFVEECHIYYELFWNDLDSANESI